MDGHPDHARNAALAYAAVKRFARSIPGGATIDDANQVALIALWRSTAEYDPARPCRTGRPAAFSTFATRCITNDLLNWSRRRPARGWALLGDDYDAAGREPAPDQAAEDRELLALLPGWLAALGPDERAVVTGRYLRGLTYEEVGRELGHSDTWAIDTARRALAGLRRAAGAD